MKDVTDSLPYLLYGRFAGAAVAAMQRAPQANNNDSAWVHPTLGDNWLPEYTSDTSIVYRRRNRPSAQIRCTNLKPSNLSDIKWSQATPIGSGDNVERHSIRADVPAGQEFQTRLGYTFKKTTSLLESAGAALKIGFEGTVNYTPSTATGGVGGGIKLSAEASAHYDKTWGETTEEQRSIDITIPVKGPFKGYISAVRKTTSLSVASELTPEFEAEIACYEGDKCLYKWDSYADLLRVLRGQAPTDRALANEFITNPFTPYEGGPISDARIKSFHSRIIPTITWTNKFDGVSDIEVIFAPDSRPGVTDGGEKTYSINDVLAGKQNEEN